MTRSVTVKSLSVVILSVLVLQVNFCLCQDNELLISKIEQGLLPVVLIMGEPSFSLEERMAHYKVPGVSIAVIKDYRLEWSRQYGISDADTRSPVTKQTLFNVGSLSKSVTALAVLSLVEEGKIDLNKNINEQLISWKLSENDYTKMADVTPYLLMNHSGGVMFSPSFSYLPENLPTLIQILNGKNPAQTKPVVIDKIPGTVFQYSNPGYSILQQLTIDISGKPYPEITREQVFNPLDMKSSSFSQPLPANLLRNASAGHMGDGQPLAVKRYVYPQMAAGGLWTTTSDYAKFVVELQKAYLGNSNKLISQNLAKQMLSPQVAKQYGLGVFMRELHGQINYFGHMGDNRGFFAGYVSHLTEGCGAVVFTNSQNGAGLIREITNGIAREYGWENYLPDVHEVVKLNKARLDDYTGKFTIGSDEYFVIERNQDELFINRFGKVQLYHTGDGKFVTKFRKGHLQFNNEHSPEVIVEYYFADELGRFLKDPVFCAKLQPGTKLPSELLEEGKFEEAAELYRKLRKKNPADIYVSENRFNRLGYRYMGKKMFEQALVIFKLNTEFYPGSANCYDSLAEAYMNIGDDKNAVKNYKKSLELNPQNLNAKSMLNKMQSNN